mmetsp:Transcript_126614/g.236678  ORF Transcript_126614/g.236678 Transcript_126614/m.236678 type:complete len:101 (-) Transcript_126614:79-381(-)
MVPSQGLCLDHRLQQTVWLVVGPPLDSSQELCLAQKTIAFLFLFIIFVCRPCLEGSALMFTNVAAFREQAKAQTHIAIILVQSGWVPRGSKRQALPLRIV